MSAPTPEAPHPASPEAQDLAKKLKFLRQDVVASHDGFRKRADDNKHRAFRLRMTVVFLGALTTFVLGAKSNAIVAPYEHYASLLALLLSATIPIFAAWDAFCDHKWLWMRYTVAYTSLAALLDDLDYESLDVSQVTSVRVDALYGRYRAVMDETNNAWHDKRTKIDESEQEKTT